MSGGHFDYAQYRIQEIMDSIEDEIRYNSSPRRDGDEPRNFSEETISEFAVGLTYLEIAQVYAQRIDWLLSGDDSEKSFHERIIEDLNEILKRNNAKEK
jgi:hypothetical protein